LFTRAADLELVHQRQERLCVGRFLRPPPDLIPVDLLADSACGLEIVEHHPDVVLHGHTHAGTFEGALGPVPVFNVAVPVLGRDFFVFELDGVSVRAAA
jgi:hypothetical protein